MSALLQIEDVHLSFGGVNALDGVSAHVEDGAIFAIIGPNGAGKTSVFNCISGVYHPQQGRLRFDGHDITRWPPHREGTGGVKAG